MKNVSKTRFVIVLLFGLVTSLMGCQTMMTREGVREAEQKRDITDKVTSLQRTTADVNSRFADVDSEQRQLNGRIEVLENRLAQAAQEREKQKKYSEEQNLELQKRVQLLQDEVTKLADSNSALSTEVANLKVSSSSDVQAASVSGKESSTTYDIAEDFFGKKDFKKAILNYQKFRDSKPKDKRVPDATYKIGVCFQELGLKDEAKSFFQELISRFPNSTEAKKAKIRLKKIK